MRRSNLVIRKYFNVISQLERNYEKVKLNQVIFNLANGGHTNS